MEGLSCRNLDLDLQFLTVYGGGGNYCTMLQPGLGYVNFLLCMVVEVCNYHAVTRIGIYTFFTVYEGGGNYHAVTRIVICKFT